MAETNKDWKNVDNLFAEYNETDVFDLNDLKAQDIAEEEKATGKRVRELLKKKKEKGGGAPMIGPRERFNSNVAKEGSRRREPRKRKLP